MSIVFGAYMSLVGVAVVFVTLLAVAATSEGLRRLVDGKKETQPRDTKELARVAAIAAVHCYIGLDEVRRPRLRIRTRPSRWSAVARVEALRIGESFLDEA